MSLNPSPLIPAMHYLEGRYHLLALDVPDAAPLHVLVLADDPLVRAGLASFFSDREDYALAGSSALNEDLDTILNVFRPNVVLWDLGAVDGDVPDTQSLRDASIPVVALLADDQQIQLALKPGVQGLMLRTAEQDLILSALFGVSQGLFVVDPNLADPLFEWSSAEWSESTDLLEDLTPRENEVLALVAEGLPNKLIADRLGISAHTVKFHVAALLSKLGARSRTEAVVVAARKGLLVV